MRHIPTSLYIDTQVFVRNDGCRVNTRAFTRLLDTFVKGGIRLLIPEMMERELLRKFDEQATKATKALINAHKTHPIASLSLIELPTEEELQAECYQEIVHQWEAFKEHFIVEKLPIVGNLKDTIDWYFKKEPPFSEKKPKEFPDAFILSALEHYHKEHEANIAVVSGDGDFREVCARRRFIAHFSSLDEYIKAFEPELQGDAPPVIALTRPITTEDLTELKAILGRDNEVTDIEVERALRLIAPEGPNYDYFFDHAKDGVWLEPLISNGYFDNPPDLEETPDGNSWAPFWPPLNYLVHVCETMPERVLEILENLPETTNSHILEGIIDAVLNVDSVEAVKRLSSRILSFVENAR